MSFHGWIAHLFLPLNNIACLEVPHFAHNLPIEGHLFFLIFIYFWSCWVFIAVQGLFSSCREWELLSYCGAQASHYGGFFCFGVRALGCLGFNCHGTWSQQLWLTGSRVVMAHKLSCFVAHGILLNQGLNPCLLHWQADFLPMNHQGSPEGTIFDLKFW